MVWYASSMIVAETLSRTRAKGDETNSGKSSCAPEKGSCHWNVVVVRTVCCAVLCCAVQYCTVRLFMDGTVRVTSTNFVPKCENQRNGKYEYEYE
mmetsp:Transcript_32431/g.76301  ORF Transcript_32431/g.76301 Transcript_32431/m.76301 type:complete len:95 (+) Transcript_32431:244-528(+)